MWHASCLIQVTTARSRPDGGEGAMDLWYELAIREWGDLNEAATEIRKDAEAALLVPPSEDADEEDE